ncbi:unnamed protein product [Fusarium graminearum]|nr:unnamed protein product [Fusarium graminearum]
MTISSGLVPTDRAPSREVPWMWTRVFGIGEVARCLSCEAYSPKTEEDHVVDDVYVVREATKSGHDGAGDKDNQAKHGDGEVRGGQAVCWLSVSIF